MEKYKTCRLNKFGTFFKRRANNKMTIMLKCLPIGSLPYSNINLVTQMMLRLFDKVPYIPFLPNIDEADNIINRTFSDDSFFKFDKNKIKLNINLDTYEDINLIKLNETYSKPSIQTLSNYEFKSAFLEQYLKIIKRIQPEETVINLIGPFSMAAYISNYETEFLITDTLGRKFLTQYLTLKSLWIISKIKEISPDTKVIILFEEHKLNEFSKLKKASESVNDALLVSLYSRLFKKLKDYGGSVGIQCFSKCNWAPILEAAPNLISFDAFTNPRNLNIIGKKVNKYITNGGYINWGIIPVKSESDIKSLTIDSIFRKFIGTTNDLIAQGVSADLLYSHSIVSIQGDTSDFSPLFTERALMLANQLSKKVPTMK